MSTVIGIQFKISLGRIRNGHIRIDRPEKIVDFSRKDVTSLGLVPTTLSGAWQGFPKGRVEQMEVMSTANEAELKWFNILVRGNRQGSFSGEIFFDQEHKFAPVHFVGLDLYGRQVFKSEHYYIELRLLDNLPRPQNK